MYLLAYNLVFNMCSSSCWYFILYSS